MAFIQFAPHLTIPNGVQDIRFYTNAFGANEVMSFKNEDGSYHVAELAIGDQIFHLHETTQDNYEADPPAAGLTTVLIGVYTDNTDELTDKSIQAGAVLVSPPQSYAYGYRQAVVQDPFGHRWIFHQRI